MDNYIPDLICMTPRLEMLVSKDPQVAAFKFHTFVQITVLYSTFFSGSRLFTADSKTNHARYQGVVVSRRAISCTCIEISSLTSSGFKNKRHAGQWAEWEGISFTPVITEFSHILL